MTRSLALAIPAYNEADGIIGFLHQVNGGFADWNGDVIRRCGW